MGIFLDTGFYLGLIHKMDENHKRSELLLHELKSGIYGRIYTSNFIMTEAATLTLIRTRNNFHAIHRMRELFIGDTQIATLIRLDEHDEKESWDLFEKINVKKRNNSEFISFVDCTNLICAKRYQIDQILAFDCHFDGWIQRIS